ncbi:hypothetical protein BCV72DRAFT_319628 [Rhizopus microsporus var. microsporus]|uniref:Uncharacterized protein n=2 Tax=Rhizopus microsporus TaxID=58291 RepID=A0A2G4SKU3_RHIZD|nr:uncharacterized protein RHIMIDRAFT_246336 [Rhizopus microsporus ATCC 52813]ORE09542.1 hypothetical protein BCV72DRAFT_319628 [Rhizopus microsporus var. microsporus]PHZ09385.1 hypothetical protein RHIMIDRAFT_246336 [Rhizopus microsporus ATCC 52813]
MIHATNSEHEKFLQRRHRIILIECLVLMILEFSKDNNAFVVDSGMYSWSTLQVFSHLWIRIFRYQVILLKQLKDIEMMLLAIAFVASNSTAIMTTAWTWMENLIGIVILSAFKDVKTYEETQVVYGYSMW